MDVFARTYGVELLCQGNPVLPSDQLLEQVQRWCPGAGPLGDKHGPDALTLIHPAHIVRFTDGSIPAQTFIAVAKPGVEADKLEHALQQSWDFESAREVVNRCSAAVLVTDLMSSQLEYQERLQLLQSTLRAVLEVVPCDAIHWQPSARIVDPTAWKRTFDAGDPAQLFFAGAVNVRMFNVSSPHDVGQREFVMDTLGLGALGLVDLQCHFRRLSPPDVARCLYNTAWYLYCNGDIIEDGNTVEGMVPGSRWRCQHEESLVEPKRIVLDVEPGDGCAAGGRAG